MVEATCPLPNGTAEANLTTEEIWSLLTKQEAEEAVYKIPAFILLGTLMITGLPGNLLVLLVYGVRFPASTTKSFIMAMAAFDLMNCVLGLPFEMVDLKNDMTFDQPTLCKFMRFLVTLSTCGSSTVLVCVSIDRFRRICRPFQKQMTVKQSKLIIGLMTLLSVFMSAPALVFYGKQTDIRYGVKTYDCTIDDRYRDTKLVALYQFFLGGVWIVSVIILIIMYSFIIYKIHKQKARRAKQSAASFGSVILTNARMRDPSVRTEEQQPWDTRLDTNTNGVSHTENVQPHANQDKEEKNNPDKPAPRQRQFSNVSFKRLFSRDVNPILEESEDNDEINDVSFYLVNDENIPLSDRSKRKKSETLTKASLNNYLAGSRDTDFTIRSISFVSQTETNADPASSRKRKLGHHNLAKYRSWGSAEFQVSRQVSVVSKTGDRKWASLSCSLLDTSDYKNDDKSDYNKESPRVFRMRRASSLPSVRDAVAKWQQGKPYNARKYLESKPGNKGSAGSFSTEESKTSLEINVSSNCWGSRGSLTSASETSVNVAAVHDPRHQTLNVTWEAIETTHHHVGDSLEKEKKDICKPRSASVATTLSTRNKNTSAREIKTSTVSVMMLMVTLAFILSYLPHLGIQVFKIISSSLMAYLLCHNRTYFVFHHILIRSFFINNAINPIIYSFYNKTFRARCIRVLKSPKSLFQSSEMRYASGAVSISQDNDTA